MKLTAFFAVVFASVLGYFLYLFMNPWGELGKSRGNLYVDLQNLELENRNKQLQLPYVTITRYGQERVVAFESGDPKFPYVWLAIDRDDPFNDKHIYVVGEVLRKTTPCRSFLNLLQSGIKSLRAERFMRGNCRS